MTGDSCVGVVSGWHWGGTALGTVSLFHQGKSPPGRQAVARHVLPRGRRQFRPRWRADAWRARSGGAVPLPVLGSRGNNVPPKALLGRAARSMAGQRRRTATWAKTKHKIRERVSPRCSPRAPPRLPSRGLGLMFTGGNSGLCWSRRVCICRSAERALTKWKGPGCEPCEWGERHHERLGRGGLAMGLQLGGELPPPVRCVSAPIYCATETRDGSLGWNHSGKCLCGMTARWRVGVWVRQADAM